MPDSLEQQALDRVARMYSSYDRRRPVQTKPEEAAEPPERPKPASPEPKADIHSPKPPGLLDMMLEDKEQSLILLLLIILMKDGADLNLILALLYLVI